MHRLDLAFHPARNYAATGGSVSILAGSVAIRIPRTCPPPNVSNPTVYEAQVDSAQPSDGASLGTWDEWLTQKGGNFHELMVVYVQKQALVTLLNNLVA